MINQRIHVSVAIEGTTNSSYLAELAKLYGAEQVLIYKLPEKKFIRLSDIPLNPVQSLLQFGKGLLKNTILNSTADQDPTREVHSDVWYTRKNLPDDTAAVHGYFTPSVIKGIVENPFTSIILRDPLERTISQYQEWKSNQGDVDWRHQIPFQKNMEFKKFARLKENTNFQSRCLGNQRLGDYDLVGVFECLPGFIAQLKNEDWTEFTKKPPAEPKIQKPRYKNLGITEDFYSEFVESNQKDYAIYEQAKFFMGFC